MTGRQAAAPVRRPPPTLRACVARRGRQLSILKLIFRSVCRQRWAGPGSAEGRAAAACCSCLVLQPPEPQDAAHSSADLQHLKLEGWVLAKGIIPPEYIHALQVRPHRSHPTGSRRRLSHLRCRPPQRGEIHAGGAVLLFGCSHARVRTTHPRAYIAYAIRLLRSRTVL